MGDQLYEAFNLISDVLPDRHPARLGKFNSHRALSMHPQLSDKKNIGASFCGFLARSHVLQSAKTLLRHSSAAMPAVGAVSSARATCRRTN